MQVRGHRWAGEGGHRWGGGETGRQVGWKRRRLQVGWMGELEGGDVGGVVAGMRCR